MAATDELVGDTGSARRGRVADVATAVVFALAIGIPGMGSLVVDVGDDVLREFRRPAPAPTVPRTAAELERYPRAAEAWFADHFALRTPLIRVYNALMLFGLGVSPTPNIVAGKDDWLFLGTRTYLGYYRAADPFTDEELEHWRAHLLAKREHLAERGIEFAFALAPNKSTVYPDKMPAWVRRVREESRGDQLLSYLRASSDLVVVDLRAPLVRARAAGEAVYYPLGSHWNDRGAFHGYDALMRGIGPLVPGVRPLPRDTFREVESSEPSDNWIVKLHLEGWLDQENPALIPKERGKKPGGRTTRTGLKLFAVGPADAPRVFVLRDSFFDALGPFVALHFSRLVLCTNRIVRASAPASIPRWIDEELPDLVIEEVVERALMDEPPPLPPWGD